MSAAKQAKAEESAERLRNAVLEMLDVIELEIQQNDGIYPHEDGKLSQVEIARRVGIHENTLYKPKYAELAEEVRKRLGSLKESSPTGTVQVRKELGTRVAEWRKLYEDLRDSHRVTETDLAQCEERLKQALEENARLRRAVSEAAGLKVVPLKKGPHDAAS